MKTSLLFVILAVSLHSNCDGQSILSSASIAHMEFSNVVVADSMSKQFLFQNALHWIGELKENNEKVTFSVNDSTLGKVEGRSTYFVYTQQAGILKKISGTISYQVSIEVKKNKYRYQFSDFVFHYYKQNRYYAMVETGKTKPLAELTASGWQKLWESHRANAINKMQVYSKQLEVKMIEKPTSPSEKVVAKKVEW